VRAVQAKKISQIHDQTLTSEMDILMKGIEN